MTTNGRDSALMSAQSSRRPSPFSSPFLLITHKEDPTPLCIEGESVHDQTSLHEERRRLSVAPTSFDEAIHWSYKVGALACTPSFYFYRTITYIYVATVRQSKNNTPTEKVPGLKQQYFIGIHIMLDKEY